MTGTLPTAADSAGIAAGLTAVMLPLGDLAPHPENPRQDLGDLTELTASIAAHGVFEPLVVLTAAAFTAAAETDAVELRPGPGITHVIVMGHRRAAAARAAGLAEAPAVIRDDLAGAPALAAMIAENLHREGLAPLDEAHAMAELARRGWRQRRIAEEIGCSQAHVSKRMALLQLPEDARDALAGGTVSVADALELHKILGAGEGADEAIGEALAEINRGMGARGAVSAAKAKLQRTQAADTTRARLEEDGTEVLTYEQRTRRGLPRVDEDDIKPHAAAGCLAASVGWAGDPEYLCTNPAGHPEEEQPAGTQAWNHAARQNEDEKEIRKAAKARDEACATVVAADRLPPSGELLRMLSRALLTGGGGHADALKMACRWLGTAGVAPAGADHYRWRDQLARERDEKTLQRYARAYTLAEDEILARGRWGPWGDRHAAHLRRLGNLTGYEPTTWERKRLAEVDACTQARGVLACTTCGCTEAGDSSSGCYIRFDRDLGQAVHECRWDCQRHRDAGEDLDDAPGAAS